LDDWTLSLLTNDEVLAIDQDALGLGARRVSQKDGLEVWVKDLKNGSKAMGLFNRSDADAQITSKWGDVGLSGQQKVRDVWEHKDLDVAADQITLPVPKHGAVLLRLSDL
jgi:alpha-galactosidase